MTLRYLVPTPPPSCWSNPPVSPSRRRRGYRPAPRGRSPILPVPPPCRALDLAGRLLIERVCQIVTDLDLGSMKAFSSQRFLDVAVSAAVPRQGHIDSPVQRETLPRSRPRPVLHRLETHLKRRPPEIAWRAARREPQKPSVVDFQFIVGMTQPHSGEAVYPSLPTRSTHF